MALSNVLKVNGGGSIVVDTANAQTAFAAAVASMGTKGGVIDIYQGDDELQFNGSTTITLDNVKIRGNGATLAFNGSTSLYGLRVQASGFSIQDCKFRDVAASGLGTGTRRILSIEDAGSNDNSKDCRILDCDFDIQLATQTVRDYQCISVVGNSDVAATMRRGLIVRGCSFYSRVNSMPNTRYVTATTTPYGITFIKTDNSGSQLITGNVFRGEFAESTLANVPDGADPQLLEMAINATVAIGGTTVAFKSTATDPTLTGIIQPKSTFTVAGDATVYTVTKQATAAANVVSVEFYPPLVAQADVNDVVVITATDAPGHVASAIHMTDHNQSIIEGNMFTFLHTQAATIVDSVGGGALIHSVSGGGESGHSQIRGNVFEDIDPWWLIRGEGGASFPDSWLDINGNMFGRIVPRCENVVSLSECGAASVVGNKWHNIGGGNHGSTATSGFPIYASGNCDTVLVALNTYDIASVGEKLFHHDGTTHNLKYYGNQQKWTI